MVVAFFGVVRSVILVPCRRGAVSDGGYMSWRRLSAAALVEWSRPCRRPNPTGQCCLLETFVWLASTSQSDQHVELCFGAY